MQLAHSFKVVYKLIQCFCVYLIYLSVILYYLFFFNVAY